MLLIKLFCLVLQIGFTETGAKFKTHGRYHFYSCHHIRDQRTSVFQSLRQIKEEKLN